VSAPRQLLCLALLVGLVAPLAVAPLHAAPAEMTLDTYMREVAFQNKREEDALAQIAQLQREIRQIETEIAQTDAATAATWQKMLDLAGLTQEQYDLFVHNLDSLTASVSDFATRYQGATSQWQAALEAAEQELAQITQHPASRFPRLDERMGRAQTALNQGRTALAMAKGASSQPTGTVAATGTANTYTVVPGDCLWRIAASGDVYGNAGRWQRLYRANQKKIKNPDLVYPGQVLTIPR